MNEGRWLGMQEGVVLLSWLGRLLGSTLYTQQGYLRSLTNSS